MQNEFYAANPTQQGNDKSVQYTQIRHEFKLPYAIWPGSLGVTSANGDVKMHCSTECTFEKL